MSNYRLEIDALNALVDEQRKTNELLTQLLITKETKTSASEPVNKPIQRRGRNKQ